MKELVEVIERTINNQIQTTMKETIKNEIQNTLKDTIQHEIQTTMKETIRNEIQSTMKETIRNEIETTLVEKINPRFDRLENRMDKLENNMESLNNTVLVIEHEHGRKLDAIFDLVNLDKEINKPKFDEISTLNKKVDNNSIHIFDHEHRISNLEESTL